MSAARYEIRVMGSVPKLVVEELEDVDVTIDDVQTVLRGPVRDQAALVGIINRLQAWGVELQSVQQLRPGAALPPQS